jgi:hypothetical protein
MKKNELTYIIREIVAEEIRRELPNAIAEVFQSVLGQKQVVSEQVTPIKRPIAPPEIEDNEEINLKQSLKEMFAGTNVMTSPQAPQTPKNFTKNPVLNEILNKTRPFSSQERTGMGAGMSAMMAQQSGIGMIGTSTDFGTITSPNITQAQLLQDNHAPLADLPQGVSVMDVKHHAPPSVAGALTRNYSQMMKLIDKKKGKV